MKLLKITNGDKSFTFYDNAEGTILNSFEGFEYSSVRSVIEDVAGNSGALYVTSRFGRRSLSWAGDLVHSDVFALRRQLLDVMRQQGSLKLLQFTTYDDLELQCEVEIIRILNPYTHKIHTYRIEAVAPDWRFYTQELFTEEVEPEVGATLTCLGNEVTNPVIRLYGPGTSFTVANLNTAQEFEVTHTLLEGEYIEIDTKERTVTLDGEGIYSSFEGDFMFLVPDENEITFNVVGSGGATKMEIIYREAYNGI